MNDFQNLKLQEEKFRKALNNLDVEEKPAIVMALELAKKAHAGQNRDEGGQYIIHPIRVANTLIYNLGFRDRNIKIAGLLHDVVEDTNITLAKIEKSFGKNVSDLVATLTRDKEKETKKQTFEKMLQESLEKKILKTCDWLDNLRSFVYRTDRGERWQRHLQEAKEMYIPLARAAENKWLIAEMEKVYDKVLRTQK